MIYVMSDLHGFRDAFVRMLDRIRFQPEDHLYILGDVIDRGPDGVRLLQDTLDMENVTLLLGNHELMMRNTMLNPTEDNIQLWSINGCAPTITAYAALPEDEQARLLVYLCKLPTELALTVNGRKFRLVHAAPAYLHDPAHSRYRDPALHNVWYRMPVDEELRCDETLIFGHTPSHYFTLAEVSPMWHGEDRIDVDCGCAIPDGGRLGCLRLDDMQEFYEDK